MDEELAALDILLRGASSTLKAMAAKYKDPAASEGLQALADARLITNNLRLVASKIRTMLLDKGPKCL